MEVETSHSLLLDTAKTHDSSTRIVVKGNVVFGIHVPSGCYVLLVAFPTVLPAFLARYTQAGTEWKLTLAQESSIAWDEPAASVIMAVLKKLKKRDKTTTQEETKKEEWNNMLEFCGQHNNEMEMIRQILVDKLLVQAKHPSSQFLMPVAKSMSESLTKWRQYLKVRPDLPEIRPPKQTIVVETVPKDHDLFGMITTRASQNKQVVDLIQQTMTTIRSLLTGRNTVQVGFQVCKESIRVRLALESLQKQHRKEWKGARWWEDAIEDAWYEDGHEEGTDSDCGLSMIAGEVIKDADGDVEMANANEDGAPKEKGASEPMGVFEAASLVLRDWIAGDVAARAILAKAMRSLETTVQSDVVDTNGLFVDGNKDLGDWMESQKVTTNANVLTYYRLYLAEEDNCEREASDDEYDGPCSKWDKDETEAAFQCCWGEPDTGAISQGDRLDIRLDHVKLGKHIQQQLDQVRMRVQVRLRSQDDKDKMTSKWDNFMRKPLDLCKEMISSLLQAGDSGNAARLLVTCARLLCSWSNGIKLVEWIEEDRRDEACYDVESKDFILGLLKKEMGSFDVIACKIAFSFYALPSECSFDAAEKFEALSSVASWFLLWLKHGYLSLPSSEEFMWENSGPFETYRRKTPLWRVYSHPASAVFRDNGWSSALLVKAFAGDEVAISALRAREPVVVLRTRLTLLDTMGLKEKAIKVAGFLGGDVEALRYLVAVGNIDMALAQASSSGDSDGLVSLASEMRERNQCASFLCAHANLLHAVEKNEAKKRGIELSVGEHGAVEFLAEQFVHTMLPESEQNEEGENEFSLQLLSSMKLPSTFAMASGSTPDMQALLEKNYDLFQSEPKLLGIAALAVIAKETMVDGLELAASKAGLLVCGRYRSPTGALLHFGDVIGCRNSFIVSCAALYECCMMVLQRTCEYIRDYNSKRLDRNSKTLDCAEFSFGGCLISAAQIAVRLKWLDPIEKVARLVHDFECEAETSYYAVVVEAIVLCFMSVHESMTARTSCPELLVFLLELYLDVPKKNDEHGWNNRDLKPIQFWIVIAYLELNSNEQSADRVARCVFLNGGINEGAWIFENMLDHGDGFANRRTRGPFNKYAESSLRCRDGDLRSWHNLCTIFIVRLLNLSREKRTVLSFRVVQTILRALASINQDIFQTGEDDFNILLQGESHLPNLPSVGKSFFEDVPVCPVTACRALNVLDTMCNQAEGNAACTPHFVFLCGIKWLRAASADGVFSVTAAIGKADAADSCLLEGLDCSNWRSLLRTHPRSLPSTWATMLSKAGPAAFFIATIVQHYAIRIMPRTRSPLKDRCQEALALCAVWHFWLCPDIDRYRHALGLWKPRTMSPKYNPAHFLDRVLQPEWCAPREDAEEIVVDSDDECYVYMGPDKNKTVPSIVPLLQQRVSLAVSQNLISEAHNLCVMAGQKGNAWNPENNSSELLELVHACLTVMQATCAKDTRLVGDEFVAVTMQAILSINWLQSRVNGSESNYASIASKRIPRDEHVDLLLTCADKWSHGAVLNADMDRCANILRLVAACIRFRNVQSIGKETDSTQQGSNETRWLDGRSEPSCNCAERAKKRQRLSSPKHTASDVPLVTNDVIAEYIDELKLLSDQLHLPEAKLWYEAAARILVVSK